MAIFTSSQVSAGDTITAAERNNLRFDVITNAGDFVVSGGSANAYTFTIDSQWVAQNGLIIKFKANHTNTGSATGNINAGGAVIIYKNGGTDALEAGDIVANSFYYLMLDNTGSKLILMSLPSKALDGNDFTAKGDLLSASAAGTKTALAIGNDKEFLMADSGETAGLKYAKLILASTTTQIAFSNSAAENTLLSVSVPGNTLGINGGIRVRMNVSELGLKGTAGHNAVFRIKLGATTIGTMTFNAISGTDIFTDNGYIELYLFNTGATNTQQAYLFVNTTGDPYIGLSGSHPFDFFRQKVFGTGAEDTTSAKTLAITLQFGTANAVSLIKIEDYIVEYLHAA